MLDQWKILKQIFLLKKILTEEEESFSIHAQDFNNRYYLKGGTKRARCQETSRMHRWIKGNIAGLSYLRVFLSCQKLHLIYFFNFKKPKFRIFPAESKFIVVFYSELVFL